jgi:hypothetical protein
MQSYSSQYASWSAGCDTAYAVPPARRLFAGKGLKQLTEVDFRRQLLLHLPRIWRQQGEADPEQIESEVLRLTSRLSQRLEEAPPEVIGRSLADVNLRQTSLGVVDIDLALAIHKCFHYLGSPRREGIHLGLYAEVPDGGSRPLLSTVTLSPFDLRHIEDALPFGIRSDEVLVLSRLFAFPSAPWNTVSFTLGRLFSWLRTEAPYVKALLTYLNPNLGFRGTVYKATNWNVLGEEIKGRYLYICGDYVTDREAVRRYGTADPAKLAATLGAAFCTSTKTLRPLKVLIYFLDPRLRLRAPRTYDFCFVPDRNLVGETSR